MTTIILSRSVQIWRVVQFLVWLVGLAIIFYLIFIPTLGIDLVWNVLIPVAPALLVIATGIWRNVCPLGFTSLLPSRLGFSKKIKLSEKTVSKFNLIGVIALLLIVPLRHVILNTSGLATGITLMSLGLIVFLVGFFFESKSGWCSGLCPVHPVEKLYGSKVFFSIPNANCVECFKCVTPCPDSTPGINPLSNKNSDYSRLAGYIMVGGFPGYIWGWFQVRDYSGMEGLTNLPLIYGYPFIGLLVSLILFWMVTKVFSKIENGTIINIFAALAVSCYYWFRIPNLFGFGFFPADGMLFDLKGTLPEAIIWTAKISAVLFFFWWLVIRNYNNFSWVIRPAYAKADPVVKTKLVPTRVRVSELVDL